MMPFRVDLLPDQTPDVEELLKRCLKQEVSIYMSNLHGLRCHLCPFRAFRRTEYLHTHLKYHKDENMYLANIRSPQLNVIRAMFDYQRSVSYIQPFAAETSDFLQESAHLIKK